MAANPTLAIFIKAFRLVPANILPAAPILFQLFLLFLFYHSIAQERVLIAHRGASGSAPENTLASFKKALEIGVDMIELDIHLSKDSILVVCHDESIDRTTNGAGEIKNMTLKELKQFDAGSWFSEEFEGEKIPTLEEAIQLVNGRTKLLIEIKGKSKVYSGLEKILLALLDQYNAKSWCIIQSFHTPYLSKIHQLDTAFVLYKLIVADLPVFPVYMDDGLRTGKLNNFSYFRAINPMDRFVSRKFIANAHARGQKVFVWTVNEIEKAKEILKLGADGIITNYPERMKGLFN